MFSPNSRYAELAGRLVPAGHQVIYRSGIDVRKLPILASRRI